MIMGKSFSLPHSWVAFTHLGLFRKSDVISESPEDRNGHLTFGTQTARSNILVRLLMKWAQIVASVPRSCFLFVRPGLGAEVYRSAMTTIFAEHVASDRIRFQCVRGNHLPWYNEIDGSPDRFSQTGATTTCGSLWMGGAVVTLVGGALFERTSYFILSNCGLYVLCTFSRQEHRNRAIGLTNDRPRRRHLKKTLRQQISGLPPGNPLKFLRQFYDLINRVIAKSV
jgi:protein O-GlcNAc transferase